MLQVARKGSAAISIKLWQHKQMNANVNIEETERPSMDVPNNPYAINLFSCRSWSFMALASSDCFIVMDMIHSPGGTKHAKTPINNVDTAQRCCAWVHVRTLLNITHSS